jgi:hypothetical protein
MSQLAEAARVAVQREIGDGDIAVTTASSDEAAAAAVEALNGLLGHDEDVP